MQYAKISGTGSYLPANRVSNDDLAKKVDTSDEWITTRTGIKFRHIADEGEKTSDLAAESARRALADAHLQADDIDLIIVATATPDMQFPSTATIVQQKLGITNGCPAFDVQAVCAGFMYAMTTAASDEPGIIHSKLKADGNYLNLLNVPGQIANGQVCGSPYISMDGPGVFKFAVKMLAKIADDVIEEAGYTADQIDWIVPHQANKRIIDSTAKHLGLSMDKVILTVQDHGNTSAASIPLALDVGIKNGQIKRGQNLLLEGIGGGFAWGAILVKY